MGLEWELKLIDRAGNTTLTSRDILNDTRVIENRERFGDRWLLREGTQSDIEITGNPFHTIRDIDQDLRARARALEDIAREHNTTPISMSMVGTGPVVCWDPIQDKSPRTGTYISILGEDLWKKMSSVLGVHVNIARREDKAADQFKLLQALDPIHALASTSPINNYRENGVCDSRMNLLRYLLSPEGESAPLSARMLDYPSSVEELEARIQAKYQQWSALAEERGVLETFKASFVPENTGYAPIRMRTNPNRFEVRTIDSAPLDIIIGISAAYKGADNRSFEGDVTGIEIAKEEGDFYFGPGIIRLPTIDTLKELSRDATINGLSSTPVRTYLGAILNFAKSGLVQEDRPYLTVPERMLSDKRTYGDLMLAHIGPPQDGAKYSLTQARQANLFMREQFLKALDYNPVVN